MRSCLVDSQPLIARFDRDDAHHERIMAFLENHPASLLTTWLVLTETCAILPAPCVQDFLTFVERGGASVVGLPGEAVTTIRSLMDKYADRPMDFNLQTAHDLAGSRRTQPLQRLVAVK